MADTRIEPDQVEETEVVVEAPEAEAEVEQSAEQVTEPEASNDANADEAAEVVVTIEGESPAPEEAVSETPLIKQLRQRIREQEKALRQVQQAQPVQQVPTLGEKPKLADFDFDEQRYSEAVDGWYARKLQIERAQAEQQQRQHAEQAKWQGTLQAFEQEKAAFAPKVAGFDELETRVKETLSPTQLGVLLHVGEKRAQVVAALGANPKVLARIASIDDPLKLAAELARLETKMAIQPRKSAPPPETVVRGKAAMPMSPEKQLEMLEAEAERTGDRTKVVQFKRQQKLKAA